MSSAQMRAAALHLAFGRLGAECVTSSAFADNAASRRVSEKLGYTPNGIRRLSVEAHDAVITANDWDHRVQQTTQAEGINECRHMFGVPAAAPPVDVILHV